MNNRALQMEQTTKGESLFSLMRQHGILKFAWLAFRHILRKTIRLDWWREILLERLLAEPIKEILPKIQVVIRQATENDLDKFKGIVNEKNYHRFKQRFKKGRICFMVLDGEKVAGYDWISFDEYDTNKQVEEKLNNKEAYLFDCLVVPEYRNNRLQSFIVAANLMYLHHQGYDRAITLIVDTNTYSLKCVKSYGFRPSRALTIFTIFGLTFHISQKYTGAL